MKRVLIVAPHLPPVDSPDGHRARLILPYLREFGWEAGVLTVRPEFGEFAQDPALAALLPADVPVHRAGAFDATWTRRLGIGSVGYRSWPHLYAAGTQAVRNFRPDLIYFATTVFPSMALGRVWRRQLDVPYVVDLQDLWVSEYRKANPLLPGRKHSMAMKLNQALEAWTMQRAAGMIAVSEAYIATMRERYPRLHSVPAATIPFGAEPNDFNLPGTNPFFRPGDGLLHGVYAGRAGADMQISLRLIMRGLREGLAAEPELFEKVRLHFIGTDYAPAGRERRWVAPVAEDEGVAALVSEHPLRVPYTQTLRLLRDADFLLVPGSDDPHYTASKIFPYILAKKPLIGIFHRASSVWKIVGDTSSGMLLEPGAESSQMLHALRAALQPDAPRGYLERAFGPHTARAAARAHADLFAQVLR